MEKHLFSLALAVAALTACTSQEIVDVDPVQGNAIGFENILNKSSRAVEGDLTNATFDNFLVYGYYIKPGLITPIQIFNGVAVHKTTETVDGKPAIKWTYEGTRYWVPDCTYFFYAYSCGDIALVSGKGNPAFSLFDALDQSIDGRALIIQQYLCDQEHQHDLVTAEHENILATTSGNGDVQLTFLHALCKAEALFTTDFPAGYKVYISNVYISDFYNRADFNSGSGVWANYSKPEENPARVALSVPENSFVENTAGSSLLTSSAFLIPKLYDTKLFENTKLHFNIEVFKDGELILERSIVGTWSPQWVKGFIYRYNINITGSTSGIEPIVFAAEQSLSDTGSSHWDTSTSLNMTFGIDAKL